MSAAWFWITAAFASSDAAAIRHCGGKIFAFSTIEGLPSSSRKLTSASPVPNSRMASALLKLGLARNACAAALTAFCSAGVYARKPCCTRFESCASTSSGMSLGDWVMKYTPTPLERMSLTTCTILLRSSFGMSLKSRWASSKKKTNLGLSASPTSGSFSKRSESIHSRNIA